MTLYSLLIFVRRFLAHFIGMAVALVVSAALFLILPVIQYQNMHQVPLQEKKYEVVRVETIIPPPKSRPKPKPKPAQKPKVNQNRAPKSMARSRLSMDLAVGNGGGGVAIGGGAAADEQMSYQEGETDMDATPMRQIPPKYPEEARKAGVAGMVRCLLTIDENGEVARIDFLETPGDYGFEREIRKAVSQWKYKPAEMDGVPVRQKIEQPFQF